MLFISVFFGVLATNNPTKFVSMSAALVLFVFSPSFACFTFISLFDFLFPWWWTLSVSLKSAIIAAIRATVLLTIGADNKGHTKHQEQDCKMQSFVCVCLVAQSCLTLCKPMDGSPPRSAYHRDSPGKNTAVSFHALLQGIFPTQVLNPGLLHCRQILYHLSHQGSSRILEWVACSFSRGSSWPRNRTRVSCIAGGFFTSWPIKEAWNPSYLL